MYLGRSDDLVVERSHRDVRALFADAALIIVMTVSDQHGAAGLSECDVECEHVTVAVESQIADAVLKHPRVRLDRGDRAFGPRDAPRDHGEMPDVRAAIEVRVPLPQCESKERCIFIACIRGDPQRRRNGARVEPQPLTFGHQCRCEDAGQIDQPVTLGQTPRHDINEMNEGVPNQRKVSLPSGRVAPVPYCAPSIRMLVLQREMRRPSRGRSED